MSAGLRRALTDLCGRVLLATLPAPLRPWGWAVRCEAARIPDDTRALLFMLDSLRGLLPRAAAAHLRRWITIPAQEDAKPMTIIPTLRHPRPAGVACAIAAVLLGVAYMAVAGAPMRYLAINIAALAIGMTLIALIGRIGALRLADGATVAMAAALVATVMLGARVEGAARWVALGGLMIQPSLVLLPPMLILYARHRSVTATAGIVAAVAAVALQPDRAMAGMLVAGLGALAVLQRDRYVVTAAIVAVIGLVSTLLRVDTLPAAPYVDQILYSAFDVHLGAGLAVAGGSALLVVPAVLGWRSDPERRARYAVFGAVWSAAILAAALGNYPTPIVGYGGSAIIGYALGLLGLPRSVAAAVKPVAAGDETEATVVYRQLFAGLA